jgi:hypothetical protein
MEPMTPKDKRIATLRGYIADLKRRNADDIARYGNGVMSTTIAADIDVNLMHIKKANDEIVALEHLPDSTARIVTIWSETGEEASRRVAQETTWAADRGEFPARTLATVMPSKWHKVVIQFEVAA